MSANPNAVPTRLTSLPSQLQKVSTPIVIGKDVLELVTGAMYVDPLTIYREYVQNAADAIDEAKAKGFFGESLAPRIDIQFDHAARSIRIRDNGIGVPASEFIGRLTAIGGKRGKRQRGFRGVGRLSGLGYAQELVFRSRARGDSQVQEVLWDGRRLREVLRNPEFTDDLAAAVKEVATLSIHLGIGFPEHFFEVELRRVARVRNDLLLNPEEIRNYLSQVAPVPFAPGFGHSAQISEHLRSHGIHTGLHIFIGGEDSPIFRPFQDEIRITDKLSDAVLSTELIEIPGPDGTVDAVGWILHHSYFGALPRAKAIAGLRLRSGNIQVGSSNTLESLFLEPRFNSWCIGEIHVLSDRIVPNGRRDEFEMNAHYQNLLSHAAGIASQLSKLCRQKSILRNRLRQARLIFEEALNRLVVVNDRGTTPLVRQHYRDSVTTAIEKLERLGRSDQKFTDQERGMIVECASLLRRHLAHAKAPRGPSTLSFLPANKKKIFIEMLQAVIESCDSPQQASAIAKRIIERAKRARQ